MRFAYEGEREPFSLLRVNERLLLQLAPWGTPGDEAGARGAGKAVYLLDPSKHLIEIRHDDVAAPRAS